METNKKINTLSVVSFISGVIVLVSLGLYYGLSQFFVPDGDVFSYELFNRFPHLLMELTIPFRNIFAPLALLTGFFGLREIKKNEMTQKGKLFAWIGMILGSGWIILGLLVSMAFLLAKIIK